MQGGLGAAIVAMTTPTEHPMILTPTEVLAPLPHSARRGMISGRKGIILAFAVAAVSDLLSIAIVALPPMQWVIDVGTALLLFLVLGRRWALLPGLITEAIPGVGIFPVWILVVLSIMVYDDISAKTRSTGIETVSRETSDR
jgi:hypothetical protein